MRKEKKNKNTLLGSKQQTYRHYWNSIYCSLLSFLFLSWVLKNNNLHLILGTWTWRHDTLEKRGKQDY